MVVGPFGQVLTVGLAYLWPAYASYKAVSLNSHELLREWLIYWLVLGFYLAVTWVTDYTLFWLPLYYEAKLLLVIFLWHNKTKGAVYIFEKYLQPLLRAHEAQIDQTVEEAKAKLADGMTRQISRARDYAASNFSSLQSHMRSFSEQPSATRNLPSHPHAE